ncbi:MAG TPA: hypothetical protein VFJ19_00625 [Nocardioidaceae bacterium]|nr:hypothetical protein [Nocardioidaceae bacterium]
MLEEHLAVGWEYDVEVVFEAAVGTVKTCLPRALGRIEPVDEQTCRLVGSTSNPYWYAEMLAGTSAPYRIVAGAEVQRAARAIGRRLLEAAGDS